MKVNARILAYRISNEALAAKELPRRLKFADWGDMAGVKGARIRVNSHTAAVLPARQRTEGWDRIALDYEHNCLRGTPEYERSQEPRAVAAYGVVQCVPGDGLYLDELSWTPHGEKFAKEYCDLSPAPVQLGDGTIVGVHSVALCRHGAIDGLSFYSVELPSKETDMDWRKWLLGFIGKGDDTKDEDLQKGFGEKIVVMCAEAAGAVKAELGKRVEILEAAVKLAPAGETVTALSAEVATLKTQIADYKGEIAKRDRQDLLSQAAREGKVVALSAEAIGKLSIEELREHIEKTAVTVPLDQRTPERIQALSVEAADVKALEHVARCCGVDPKSVK